MYIRLKGFFVLGYMIPNFCNRICNVLQYISITVLIKLDRSHWTEEFQNFWRQNVCGTGFKYGYYLNCHNENVNDYFYD